MPTLPCLGRGIEDHSRMYYTSDTHVMLKRIKKVLAGINKNQAFAVVAIVSFLVGGLLAGSLVAYIFMQQPVSTARPLRQSDIPSAQSDYHFIDPLIALRGTITSSKYDPMKMQVSDYIADQNKNGLISATVYYRDIKEQGGFVLNPTVLYTPASLYKVPVMMVYYKIAERDSSILEDRITYGGEEDHNSVEEIKSAIQLVPGRTYTVEQLIEHMIRYSDNNALHLLTDHLKDTNNLAEYATVFNDLGINLATLSEYTDNVTAQQYSIFIRALYNATYLSREHSEQAMKLLSETDFSEGIESGVPNDILVAQKFGEVRMTDSLGTLLGKQLNNCGVVYYPEHPYMLCIMTKKTGDDVKSIENIVSTISRIVYKNTQVLYP